MAEFCRKMKIEKNAHVDHYSRIFAHRQGLDSRQANQQENILFIIQTTKLRPWRLLCDCVANIDVYMMCL